MNIPSPQSCLAYILQSAHGDPGGIGLRSDGGFQEDSGCPCTVAAGLADKS